jgi:AcrR family transcriptional regulator
MALIEAAQVIIREEGTAAVTTGRLAIELNLSRHIIHYYFGTIEELFLAVMRHEGDAAALWYEQILASDAPLRLLWEHPGASDARSLEYLAMALRSKAIEAEVRRSTEALRAIFTRAIELHLARHNLASNVPPATIAIMILAIARTLNSSRRLGVSAENVETKLLIEDWGRDV